jgi:hypothetical protein
MPDPFTTELAGSELRMRYPTKRANVVRVLEMLAPEVTGLLPENLAAFEYPSMEAALAYEQANRVHHGHRSYAVKNDEGVFGVVDYSKSIEEARRERDLR